jgi:chromosome segregation ATPase
MANPSVLNADTILFSPAEPEGRLFPAGEMWPGDAWSAKRGGEPVGANSTLGAMKDLIKAQDTIDNLSSQLASAAHDLAVIASERDEANGKVHDLEQRAIDAEGKSADAETAAKAYMIERDQARGEVQAQAAKLSEANATIDRLMGELNTASQALADANAQIESLTAPPAKKPAKAAADAASDA